MIARDLGRVPLPARLALALFLDRYGLRGPRSLGLEAAAERYAITRAEVRQLEARILRALMKEGEPLELAEIARRARHSGL